MEALIRDNTEALEMCRLYGVDYLLIDGSYHVDGEWGYNFIPRTIAGENTSNDILGVDFRGL